MEYGWFSHVLLWFVGVLTLCSTIGGIAALFSLGRQAYKD